MKTGCFYFLEERYFLNFPDPKLMKNKETIDGQLHDRPCFFSFFDNEKEIYWLIPFSSNIGKYKDIYDKKVTRNGRCDTIVFGNVLGHQKAFLIQNMCPATDEYIKNEYVDFNAVSVRVDGVLERRLIQSARKVLALVRQGKPLIFPDVLKIEKELLEKMFRD